MPDYDIEDAFRAIENELIDSMIRNLKHHRAEETDEGFEWTSWQTEQLNALNKYKTKNNKTFKKRFSEINSKISEGIRQSKDLGSMDEEISILEAIKKGFKPRKASSTMQAQFFKINERKLDALIKATTNDMQKAESAMLRMANDQYRKVIFNAQVYANTGAGTYEKAVDMATKDFLSRGINCIQYKNGARVNIASYAAMAIRTANTRAYLQGEGEKRQEWGISTVIVNKRGHACLKCLKWTGKVLIDDVWSGGKVSDGPYPLMSTAMAQGLYHPNCKDGHTTFFPGISEEPEKLTRKEINESVEASREEQRQQYAQRQAERFGRLADNSLDEDNQSRYELKADEWKNTTEELISDNWRGLKYPQRKTRGDFTTDDEWQTFRKSFIEDFNKYNSDVDRVIKNHDNKVENITEKSFIKWAGERGIENVNIKGMSKTAMADFMSSYDSMIKKLPKASGRMKSIDVVNTKKASINQKALAWSDNDTSIHFARSHFSKDKYGDVLQQEILSSVTGLNPDGTNPYLHTYQHEMGHLIEKWAGKEAGGIDKLKDEMLKAFESNLPDISDYGNNHGYGEWFAEMTSSYLNGTKGEKIEKFGSVVEKYLGSSNITRTTEHNMNLWEEEIKISKKRNSNAMSVNRELVNSKTYHDKFESIGLKKETYENVYSESKRILEKSDGTDYEYMAVFDKRTGKTITSTVGLDNAIENKVSLSIKEYQKIVDSENDVVVVHNHSRNGRPSGADILTCFKNEKISHSLIACHDGDLFVLSDFDRNYNVDKIYNDYYNEHIRKRLNLSVNEDIPNNIGEHVIKECKIKATTDLYSWNKKQHAFQIRRL